MGLILAVSCSIAKADTQLRIITAHGVVSFAADESWTVLSMQTKPPVSAVVFQLPNTADESTSHSSNLILKLYDESGSARQAFEAPSPQYGEKPLETERWEEWRISRQEAHQGDVLYTIIDAKRSGIADVSASVRIAWPHLPDNAATYDKEMHALFRAFLGSIHGQLGAYVSKGGETIRRSSK